MGMPLTQVETLVKNYLESGQAPGYRGASDYPYKSGMLLAVIYHLVNCHPEAETTLREFLAVKY